MKKVGVLLLAGLIASLGFTSCSSEFNTEESFISISIIDESRTAFPVFDSTTLTGFSLSAKQTDSNNAASIDLGTWSTYSELNAAKIPLTNGIYDFTLKAEYNGTKFSGTVTNKQIVTGAQTINFVLSVDSYSTFTDGSEDGKLEYTLKWQKNDLVKDVWVFYDSEENYVANGTLANKEKLTSKVTTDTTKNISSVLFTKDLKISSVILQFKLYYDKSDDGIPMASSYVRPFTDNVKLVSGITSKQESTIDFSSIAHTITYIYNVDGDDENVVNKELLPGSFTEGERIIFSNIEYPRKQFIGWHRNLAFSDSVITTWDSYNVPENITLYAEWQDDEYTINYLNATEYTKGVNSPDKYTYFRDLSIPEPSKTAYKFDGWIIKDSEGNILKETYGSWKQDKDDDEKDYFWREVETCDLTSRTYDKELFLTAKWCFGPIGDKTYTQFPIDSYYQYVAFADGSCCSWDSFKNSVKINDGDSEEVVFNKKLRLFYAQKRFAGLMATVQGNGRWIVSCMYGPAGDFTTASNAAAQISMGYEESVLEDWGLPCFNLMPYFFTSNKHNYGSISDQLMEYGLIENGLWGMGSKCWVAGYAYQAQYKSSIGSAQSIGDFWIACKSVN